LQGHKADLTYARSALLFAHQCELGPKSKVMKTRQTRRPSISQMQA